MKDNTNRLIRESSPYLRQHAHNPVDWFPWGAEAFAKARAEGKPVFLSIGYSTCHWCHVMAHESFEHPGIAALLNTYFVPVKVDREERPEVDAVYMNAVTAMTGQGGWPLSVFLTPALKPFFGGTYFPPEARYGAPGFRELLETIRDRWAGDRQTLAASSDALVAALQEHPSKAGQAEWTEDILRQAGREWAGAFDARDGGFGEAPKFPMGHVLSFLLRLWSRTGEDPMRDIVTDTLDRMRTGGIWDHVGGGFHRYATDARWQIPHFEKMLYDQAWLARAYTEGFQVTGAAAYAETARQILDYVLRDLRAPSGVFYCAEDADSLDPASGQMREGAFYLWGYEELRVVLTPEEFRAAELFYGLRPGGNAEYDPHGEFAGKNVLAADRGITEAARTLGVSEETIRGGLARGLEKLFEARRHRPRPHRDEKILTDWNGMMIAALAFGAGALEEPRYLDAARAAVSRVLRDHRSPAGELFHVLRGDQDPVPGHLGDYAFLIDGLLCLYEEAFCTEDLNEAVRLAETMTRLFSHPPEGGFFLTAAGHPDLILRPQDRHDGAMPSAAAMAAGVLTRLAVLTQDDRWQKAARDALQAGAAVIQQRPSAYTGHLTALDFLLGPVDELALAMASPRDLEMLRPLLHRSFVPRRTVRVARAGAQGDAFVWTIMNGKKPVDGMTTLYWCHGQTCYPPVVGLPAIRQILTASAPGCSG